MSGTRKRSEISSGLVTRDALDQFMERLQAAKKHFKDQAGRLAWLLALIEKTTEEIARSLADSASQLRIELVLFAFEADPYKAEPIDQVLEAIDRVRACLRNLRQNWEWKLNLTFPGDASIIKHFSVVPKSRRLRWSGAIESFLMSNHFPTSFLLIAGEVIEAEGLRIHECARSGCGRLFVKRKRGSYCSIQCSQKERDRRFRERHSSEEIKERRHRLYLREVETKHGSARARHVTPRPPKDGSPNARKKTREQ
jgi:hypothetical protein